jgi:hypothetical protein
MDPHNAFGSSHFPERVDGNWLAWGVCESECVEGLWDPVVLGGWKGGWEEGLKEGRRPTAEQWKPISDKVEAH